MQKNKFDIRTNRAYNRKLKNTVNNLLTLANVEEMSIIELAHKAKLSPQTVYNLVSGITRLPRYSTIYQLAVALGVDQLLLPEKKV